MPGARRKVETVCAFCGARFVTDLLRTGEPRTRFCSQLCRVEFLDAREAVRVHVERTCRTLFDVCMSAGTRPAGDPATLVAAIHALSAELVKFKIG
jgi:hypothetical protein